MVADEVPFEEYVEEVQQIIDRADYIVGFEVESDVRMLESYGIDMIPDERILEMREWYWLIQTPTEPEYTRVPSLYKCAQQLGFDWEANGGAHHASTDTLATIYCYQTLMANFMNNHPDVDVEDAIAEISESFRQAKSKVDEEHAKGYVILESVSPKRYHFQFKSLFAQQPQEGSCFITVADRHKAKQEIRSRFYKKLVTGTKDVYQLTDKDLRWFYAYTNSYDEE